MWDFSGPGPFFDADIRNWTNALVSGSDTVRVGANKGPYGPLFFFEKGYVSGSDGSV